MLISEWLSQEAKAVTLEQCVNGKGKPSQLQPSSRFLHKQHMSTNHEGCASCSAMCRSTGRRPSMRSDWLAIVSDPLLLG